MVTKGIVHETCLSHHFTGGRRVPLFHSGWCILHFPTIFNCLTNNPLSERKPFAHQPSDYQLEPQDISLKTADGLTLSAWYLPSQNRAVVIVQHGYKSR